MRLSDVLELGVRHAVEKRAGVLLPLTVGAMIPGIVHRALERARSTEQALERSTYDPMKTAALPPWLAQARQNPMQAAGAAAPHVARAGQALGVGEIAKAPAAGVAGAIQKLMERGILGREFGERKDPFSMGGAAAVQAFGKEMGTSGAHLLQDIANKAMEAVGHAGDASARQAIIGDLKRTDSVLANADDATLMEAYHTMTRFAPVLSTDKNAVRSFLRQAVMSGSGPDYMSIKLLADSEHAVTGGDKKAAAIPSTLAELLPSLGRGVLLGAGTGAISGAMADKDDRTGGALRGALTGGALGGLGGALHGRLTKEPSTPVNQGYARGVVPRGEGVPWSKLDYLRDIPEFPPGKMETANVGQHLMPDSPQGYYRRNVPAGVEELAHVLQYRDPSA